MIKELEVSFNGTTSKKPEYPPQGETWRRIEVKDENIFPDHQNLIYSAAS